MTAISGQNYAGFSSSMVQGAQLFMNNFANQTGGGGSRSAAASRWPKPATSPAIPRSPPQWGAWGGALGGLGTIGANQPLGGVTYNVGGFAAGLDRAITPTTARSASRRATPPARNGSAASTAWAGPTPSRPASMAATARTRSMPTPSSGYAYSWQPDVAQHPDPRPAAAHRPGPHRRQPVLRPGRDRLSLRSRHGTANAFVTPFARLQAYTGTQNAFTETGAQSLNLTVAQQTTNSLRSVLGAQLGGGDGSRLAREARDAVPAGLEPRVCRHRPAGDGDPGRRAGACRSRPTACRRSATASLVGVSANTADRRGDVALSPLRGQHLRPGQRARPHRRRAHDVVSGAARAHAIALSSRRASASAERAEERLACAFTERTIVCHSLAIRAERWFSSESVKIQPSPA